MASWAVSLRALMGMKPSEGSSLRAADWDLCSKASGQLSGASNGPRDWLEGRFFFFFF